MSLTLKSGEVPVVFVMVEVSGKLGSIDSMGLHEAVIARQKVVAEGESLTVHKTWPAHAKQFQLRADNLRDVYHRLVEKYKKDLVEDVYGPPHQGRLKSVMLRIYEAFLKGVPYDKIIELGRPDHGEFIDLDAQDEEQTEDDGDEGQIDSVGAAADAGTAPDPAHAATGGMKPLGGDDAEDDAPTVDGGLVEHLEGQGWNNVQATNVARLIGEMGYEAFPDDRLKEAIGVTKEDARRRIREHIAAYRATKEPAAAPKAAKPAKPKRAAKKRTPPATAATQDPAPEG